MPTAALTTDLTATTLSLAGAGGLMMLPFSGANAAGVSVTVPASMLNAAGQLVDPAATILAALPTPVVRALMIKEVYQKYTTPATLTSLFSITGLIGSASAASPIFSDTHTVLDAVLGAVFNTGPSTKLVATSLPFVCAPGPVKPLIAASGNAVVQGYILAAWIIA